MSSIHPSSIHMIVPPPTSGIKWKKVCHDCLIESVIFCQKCAFLKSKTIWEAKEWCLEENNMAVVSEMDSNTVLETCSCFCGKPFFKLFTDLGDQYISETSQKHGWMDPFLHKKGLTPKALCFQSPCGRVLAHTLIVQKGTPFSH